MIRHTRYLLAGLIMLLLAACSTSKNTAGTRFYHKVTAHYNTYFNGSEAYKEGCLAQETGNKDDYTSLIPMYPVGNKKTAEIGKGNFETAITKCEKAIKQHSIKKKPTFSANHRKTPKDRAMLARKEYNPFLKNAWMLMGRAQYHQGDFIEAASTFNYVSRLYAAQPQVNSMARAWLARCYVELGWLYDAEDVFNKMRRDSMTTASMHARDAAYAGYLIKQQHFKEAIPYLEKSVKYEPRKRQRARQYFLLGQLYRTVGDNANAYKHLKKVVRTSPPYELEFNARILQTEVMAKGQSKQMIRKLQRMAKDQKNVDYLDQVYYAIGNIYLTRQDTANAISSYETGVKKATRSGVEKGVLLLHLGELYWAKENYIEAQRCYAQVVSLLDKEHAEYEEANRRSGILTELEPHLSAIKLQDSLQVLAKLPEADRLKAIDRVIDALKKKEKEEAKNADNGTTTNNTGATTATTTQKPVTTPTASTTGGGAWYFYNPMIVQQGKADFKRKWGTRANADDWQRSNKATVANEDFAPTNYDEEAADSTQTEEATAEGEKSAEAIADSLANDPHQREYYLKQIPFTDEQLAASNATLSDALYNAAIIEKDKLENLPLADRTFTRLYTLFPDYGKMADVYYNMFLLKYREGNHAEATSYKNRLIAAFPDHKYSTLLSDPNYELNARYGKHLEDSIYADAYNAYMAANYGQVRRNAAYAEQNYPEGANRPKFIFLDAMSQLQTGDQRGFLAGMKTLGEKYPKADVSDLAAQFVKGVESGRTLTGGGFDANSLWARRGASALADSASTDSAKLSAERNCNFVFLIAYPQDSINENELLYNLAHYNFTNFMVRNFDINIVKADGIARMQVSGFLSFDEAHAYAQQLYQNKQMAALLKGLKAVIISEANLKLLGIKYSFDDYQKFYDKTFAPLVIPKDLILDMPTEIITEPTGEEDENAGGDEEGTDDDGGGIIIDTGDEEEDNGGWY